MIELSIIEITFIVIGCIILCSMVYRIGHNNGTLDTMEIANGHQRAYKTAQEFHRDLYVKYSDLWDCYRRECLRNATPEQAKSIRHEMRKSATEIAFESMARAGVPIV